MHSDIIDCCVSCLCVYPMHHISTNSNRSMLSDTLMHIRSHMCAEQLCGCGVLCSNEHVSKFSDRERSFEPRRGARDFVAGGASAVCGLSGSLLRLLEGRRASGISPPVHPRSGRRFVSHLPFVLPLQRGTGAFDGRRNLVWTFGVRGSPAARALRASSSRA